MDLSLFKQDIDDLIHEFVQNDSSAFNDMKRKWSSMKFSYIYEASPSTNLAFFMQSLYAHTIGHMVNVDSLSYRLGGLYCLYCLYETQPFKPPFKIYLSLGEMKKLKSLVGEAKETGINVVPALVKRMLEKNMFLFGFVDLNEGSVSETINNLTKIQDARIQVAYEKLFTDTDIERYIHLDLGMEVDLNKIGYGFNVYVFVGFPFTNRLFTDTDIERYIHLDLGMEVDINKIKKMSTEYAGAKRKAIEEVGEVVDVRNIKHISENNELLSETVENIDESWNNEREAFHQRTGLSYQKPAEEEQPLQLQLQLKENEDGDEFYRLLYEHD